MNDHGIVNSDVVVSSPLFWDGFTPLEISVGFLFVKLTLVVGAALLLRMLLVGRASASVRHAVLTAGLMTLPIVALFHFSGITWNLPGLKTYSVDQSELPNAANVATFVPSEPGIDGVRSGVTSTWTNTQANPFAIDDKATTKISSNSGELRQAISSTCFCAVSPKEVADVAVFPAATFEFPENASQARDSTPRKASQENQKAASNSIVNWMAEYRSWIYYAVLALWGMISTLLLARLAMAWLAINRQLSMSTDLREHPVSFDRDNTDLIASLHQKGILIRVLQGNRNAPSAIGLVRPTILLPESCVQWTNVHWRSVLLHESAHLQRLDCWTNLLGRMIHAALWWHPLVPALVSALRVDSEQACDDQVLRSGVNRADYADALLDFASSRNSHNLGIAAIGMVGIHPIESRISSILSHRSIRQPLARTHAVALMIVATFAAMLLAALQVGIADRLEPVTIQPIESITNSRLVQSDTSLACPEADTTPFDPSNGTSQDAATAFKWEFLLRNGGHDWTRTQGSFQVVIETEFGSVSVNSDSLLSLSQSTDRKNHFLVRTVHGGEFVGKLASQFELVEDSRQSLQRVLRNVGSMASTDKVNESATTIDPYEPNFSLRGIRDARMVPGQITSGVSVSGLGWHVRLPSHAAKNPDQRWPTLVVLHQQESNGLQYLRKIETVWPELAERYILVGIDGELRAEFDSDRNPRHSYSFINFAGNSDLYTGFPGTDRESPALVAETLGELRKTLPTDRILLAGHHDGACVALSVLMNYPETIDGAVLMSVAMIIQNEPTAFTNEARRRQQRERPLVLVHARRHAAESLAAWNALQNDSFERAKLIEIEEGEPGFTNLALDQAVEWLESN
ncbi:MAG: M56 family metallopeptidase [Pirellulaceae bacterium]|nr:M56 family metallopeptidase [Pirellulaceae bacterium]